MSSTEKTADGRHVITLDGDLTLQNAEELRSLFVKALVEADLVAVRFGDVREADLSLLQLLCSAHRSAVRLKKQVRLEGAFPKVFLDRADAAGFTRLKGCKPENKKSCFWIAIAGENHG